MKVSEQRLSEIIEELQREKAAPAVSREEWLSMVSELRQLRLRTSAQSRSAAASLST